MSWARRWLAGLALVSGAALAAVPGAGAQAPPGPGPAAFGARGMNAPGMMGSGMMGLAGIPARLDAPIPGKPFTATAELSYGQGRSAPVQLARDAAGRTYLKATLPLRGVNRMRPADGANPGANPSAKPSNAQAMARPVSETVIVIADPVAHRQYVIYPAAKNIEMRPLGRMEFMARMPGMGRGQSVTTTLGTGTVAGQTAEGLKTVTTIPARGSQPATTMTREVWRSPALQLVLKASATGARGGVLSFTVQSLHTGAPAPTLFELPAGYTLQTAPLRRAGRMARGGDGAFSGGFGRGFGRGRGRSPGATPPPPTSAQ